MYALQAESSFDAAHFLSDYEGKCENLHGHRWRVVATICADKLQEQGEMRDMVVDFSVFKRDLKSLTAKFDHMFIVEEGTLSPQTVSCLQDETFKLVFVDWRTTAENFARHFAGELAKLGYEVDEVEVDETPANRAFWRKER